MTGYRECLDRLTERGATGSPGDPGPAGISDLRKKHTKVHNADRVAWKAESKQRYQKGMHFK